MGMILYSLRLLQAKFIITHDSLENVAIEAAEAIGMDKSKLYSMGSSTAPKKLKCIRYVLSLVMDQKLQLDNISA